MKLQVSVDDRPAELSFEEASAEWRFDYRPQDGLARSGTASLVRAEPGIYSVLIEGLAYEVRVVAGPDGYYVDIGGRRSVVKVIDPRALSSTGPGQGSQGRQTVTAPMPGKVVRVLIAEGDEVAAGAGLIVVEAMKMQNELKSPKAGRIVQLKAQVGATVKLGELLAVVE